ncbi:MAG: DnaD domain protein [Bacillota bacterium]
MTRKLHGTGEFGFVEALMKRGFINIPRMMFDYTLNLGLDYDRIGKIFAVLACVGGPGESAFGSYTVTRRTMPQDFDQVRTLVIQLQEDMITRCDSVEENEITFSFSPLYSSLRAVWEEHRMEHEKEQARSGPHPAIAMAERLLGRPLSDRDVREILEWVNEMGFELDMVEAVIREGQRQGVTRMGYLKAIAQGWADAGIQTPEQAAAYIQEHQKVAAKYRQVTQALGIMRPLTASEQAVLDRWFHEWGFHDDVILQACERATGSKNPLQYTNKVLEAWKAEGIRTPADLEQMVDQRKRTAAAGAEVSRPGRNNRKPPAKSNVLLRRDKKDESYYDHIYKKFSE